MTDQSYLGIKNYKTYHTPHPKNKAFGGRAVIIKYGKSLRKMSLSKGSNAANSYLQVKCNKTKSNSLATLLSAKSYLVASLW